MELLRACVVKCKAAGELRHGDSDDDRDDTAEEEDADG